MKRSVSLLLTAFMGVLLVLGGCAKSSGQPAPPTDKTTQQERTAESSGEESSVIDFSGAEITGAKSLGDTSLSCQAGIRVGFLKGAASMGLASLMDKSSKGETSNVYEFTMAGKADELMDKMAKGELDIALMPANAASVLYHKTQGNVTALDINTPGVAASDDSISSAGEPRNKESGSILVTGVTLVRSDFLRENRSPIEDFLSDRSQKSLPHSNIACLTGQEMKDTLSEYLSALMEQDPNSIGGSMPGDDFYYIP